MFKKVTKEQASSEIGLILEKVKEKHPAFIDGLHEECVAEFWKQESIELKNMPEEVTVLRLWQSASRVLSKLKDAHTSVHFEQESSFWIPLAFEMKDGNVFCTEGEYKNCLVSSIGGVDTQELYKTFLAQTSYELECLIGDNFARRLSSEEQLAFLNVDTSKPVEVVFETPSGRKTQAYKYENKSSGNKESNISFVSYDIDKEKHLGIFTLNKCINDDTYRNKLKDFFKEVIACDVRYIAVDLRRNGGGDSSVADEFISYLNIDKYFSWGGEYVRDEKKGLIKKEKCEFEIDNRKDSASKGFFGGKVYALTSSFTFSSATAFATKISDNDLGEIVGETSGGMPTCYGDLLVFSAPLSKLTLAVSWKYYRRPKTEKDAEPLTPHYPVPADDALLMVYKLVT